MLNQFFGIDARGFLFCNHKRLVKQGVDALAFINRFERSLLYSPEYEKDSFFPFIFHAHFLQKPIVCRFMFDDVTTQIQNR